MSAALAYALGLEAETVAIWRREIELIDSYKIPCPGQSWRHWPRVQAGMLLFLDDWGVAAIEAGWTDIGLFGVHRRMGAVRADSTGALVTFTPYQVEALASGEIHFVNGLVDRGLTNPAESIPLWSFVNGGRR
ncbi:hypothetical protein [Methylobacterium iners]|uniref:Uncharacterized protein n=1 Tax=Methylobacterium iners TaxID=418707 RepID=A0ABQ4RQ66_9HYPH|nr:hypothetical protein [Methylobacterium iners]GJD92900.1 hypothetical protein OCOJLMKI_0083 [Methylobacterium iners]